MRSIYLVGWYGNPELYDPTDTCRVTSRTTLCRQLTNTLPTHVKNNNNNNCFHKRRTECYKAWNLHIYVTVTMQRENTMYYVKIVRCVQPFLPSSPPQGKLIDWIVEHSFGSKFFRTWIAFKYCGRRDSQVHSRWKTNPPCCFLLFWCLVPPLLSARTCVPKCATLIVWNTTFILNIHQNGAWSLLFSRSSSHTSEKMYLYAHGLV